MLALTLLAVSSVSAQEASLADVDIRGNVSAGLWSGDRVLSGQRETTFAKLLLQVSGKWDAAWSFHGNASYSYVDQVGDLVASKATKVHLRDAYVKWDGEQTEWKLGTQVFSWGRADRINPTDNLSARDFTSPFVVDDEQRLGSFASSFSQDLNANTRLNLVVQKVKKSVFPSDRLETKIALLPDARQYDYAIKLDQIGSDIDWSVSYFDGVEKSRSLELVPSGGNLKTLQRGYRAMQALGADAAGTFGAWGLRAEVAYWRFKQDPKPNSGRLSHWFGVVGIERNLAANATFGMQYFFRRFSSDPRFLETPLAWKPLVSVVQIANNQFHQWQDGVTVRYAQRLMNDQLDYEIVAMTNLRDGDVAFRPRLNYRYSDSTKWVFGCDFFRGRDHSFFGSLKKNSLALAEVNFIF